MTSYSFVRKDTGNVSRFDSGPFPVSVTIKTVQSPENAACIRPFSHRQLSLGLETAIRIWIGGICIMTILEVKRLQKIYSTRLGGNKVEALKNVTFTVEQGEYVAIMGESGSGKTTLLNILAALDQPTSGSVWLDGKDLSRIGSAAASAFRRDNLGFVFQEFNLLDTFTLEDNIYLPLVLAKKPYREMRERLAPLAEKLGIADLLKKYPYEVSGGQKQRAAVARAVITDPKLILADEPTGALDSRATDELLRLFAQINRLGQTILMVTHSVKAASTAGRVLFIKDGEVFHQLYRGEDTDQQLYQKISDTLTLLATGKQFSA